MTISPVTEAAQAELALDLRRGEALHAFFEDEAADLAVVVLAQTTNTSAIGRW
jgi:hypothetical protein